jgi:integrase
MDWMLTAGGRRSGKPGTGLSGRTARLTLGRLSAALEMAVLEGKLVRNVARLVKPPEHTQRERETWSNAEVRKFPAKASRDRLHAAWRLSLYGLRRSEVLGLRGRIST